MASSLEHEKLKDLLRRLGDSDREVALRLGVNPSTVWRLRNGKIYKINRYIRLASLAVGEALPQVGDRALVDLMVQAEASPRLRALLLSLRDVLQESATAISS
jgi:transcriptional regulator with XRE-family HTH domain